MTPETLMGSLPQPSMADSPHVPFRTCRNDSMSYAPLLSHFTEKNTEAHPSAVPVPAGKE